MGYEDNRVIGKIKISDRCSLCGLLCSLDLFIETKCYHLFCAECFVDYLIRNGHLGEIRDESNYKKSFNPVRCPISYRILEFKHTKGDLLDNFMKVKKFFQLSQYKIKCEFYPFGCYAEVKLSRLNQHYRECFFTSKRAKNKDFQIFAPDYFCNNLYEEVGQGSNLLEEIEINDNGNLKFKINSEYKKQNNLIPQIKNYRTVSLKPNNLIDKN